VSKRAPKRGVRGDAWWAKGLVLVRVRLVVCLDMLDLF